MVRTPFRTWVARFIFALVAFGVFSPALRTPFFFDDYLHASMVEGTFPVHRRPWDMYDFVGDSDRDALVAQGYLPWWSDAHLKIRFFRPLSSLIRFAEHRIFGASPLLFHVHSFAWWAIAVAVAHRFLRRLLHPRAAALAAAIFGLAPCHMVPLAWLANREALISLTFGTLALSSYLSFSKDRNVAAALRCAFLFSVALASGEYAICFLGYVIAFEVFRREHILRRFVTTLPFIAPAAVYLSIRAHLGYGTRASAFYADPFASPMEFLESAPRRLLTLIAEAWFTLDGDTLTARTPLWLLLALVALTVALLRRPLGAALGALPARERQACHALLLGSVLCLFPMLAVMPSPRLLGASVLGVAALVGVFLQHAWFPSDDATAVSVSAGPAKGLPFRREIAHALAVIVGFFHLVHAPVTAFASGRSMRLGAVGFQHSASSLRSELGSPLPRSMVILRGFGDSFFLPFGLGQGAPPLKQWRLLSMTGHVLIERQGPRSLRMTLPEGMAPFPTGVGNLFRPADATYARGDRVSLPGLEVEIVETSPAGPSIVLFHFEHELEQEDVVWLTESVAGFRTTPPPAVGFGMPID